MRPTVQLAAALMLATAVQSPAQFHLGGKRDKNERPRKSDVEWLWQYGPTETQKDGNENGLVQDDRFRPMLAQNFTAPQTFWGDPGRYKPLDAVALDYLSVPGKVIAEDNRYLTVTGCVVHFCPARGMLWVDLNSPKTLMVFNAIDWIKESHATSEPDAEYTLWIFPDQPLTPGSTGTDRIPPALARSIGRWTAEPLPGSGIVQRVTHAILVEPDGTPHELPIDSVGITLPQSTTKKDTQ
ncbi:MAG TPA: hypothetical protein VGC07_08840 [Granulicella sp.]